MSAKGEFDMRLDDCNQRFVKDTLSAARRMLDSNRDDVLRRLTQDLESFAMDVRMRPTGSGMVAVNSMTSGTMSAAPDLPGQINKLDKTRLEKGDGRGPLPPETSSIKLPNGVAPFCGDAEPASKTSKLSDDAGSESIVKKKLERQKAFGPGSSRRRSKAMHPSSAVFADATSMKEQIRQNLAKKEYNVEDYYWDTGIAQKIARSPWFENFTLSVIAFNALWIWVDTDYNDHADLHMADIQYQLIDHSLCTYFTLEWIIRFAAFRKKINGFKDFWFIADGMMLAMMVVETWIMTAILAATGYSISGLGNTELLKLVRLLRLSRMARMAKLLKTIPELVIMVRGILVASKSVFFTLVLLLLIMYVFAIVLVQLSTGTPMKAKYFTSVFGTIYSLILSGIVPDFADMLIDCGEYSILLVIAMFLFILLATITVMNMLIGVLCEVISVVSAVEKEQLSVNYVSSRLYDMFVAFSELDGDEEDHLVSKNEFNALMLDTEAAKIMQEIGVDVVGLVDYADYLFKECDGLTFAQFMEQLLQLRGSNTCTVKDIVDLRRYLQATVNESEKEMRRSIDQINVRIDEALRSRCGGFGDLGSGIQEIKHTEVKSTAVVLSRGPNPSNNYNGNEGSNVVVTNVGRKNEGGNGTGPVTTSESAFPHSQVLPPKSAVLAAAAARQGTTAAGGLPGDSVGMPGGLALRSVDKAQEHNMQNFVASNWNRSNTRPGTANSLISSRTSAVGAPNLPYFPRKMWENDCDEEAEDVLSSPSRPQRPYF